MTKLKIYQIKNIETTDYAFMSYMYARAHGLSIEDYDCVEDRDMSIETKNTKDLLEWLFMVYNGGDKPNGMRSMSVSDIVELNGNKYYCDSVGWIAI